MVAQLVKPLLGLLISHVGMLLRVPATLLPVQPPVTVPGRAADNGLGTWFFAIHMGDVNGVPSSRLQPGPAQL